MPFSMMFLEGKVGKERSSRGCTKINLSKMCERSHCRTVKVNLEAEAGGKPQLVVTGRE